MVYDVMNTADWRDMPMWALIALGKRKQNWARNFLYFVPWDDEVYPQGRYECFTVGTCEGDYVIERNVATKYVYVSYYPRDL